MLDQNDKLMKKYDGAWHLNHMHAVSASQTVSNPQHLVVLILRLFAGFSQSFQTGHMAADPIHSNMAGIKEEIKDATCLEIWNEIWDSFPYHGHILFICQAAEAGDAALEDAKSLSISEKLTAKMEEAGPTELPQLVHRCIWWFSHN